MKTQKRNNLFSIIRVSIAILILAVGSYTLLTNSSNLFVQEDNQKAMGVVLEASGVALIKADKASEFTNIQQDDTLSVGTTAIVTGLESRVTLKVNEVFEIQPNSFIRIQIDTPYHIQVFVDRGTVVRTNPKDSVDFLVGNEVQKQLKIQGPIGKSLVSIQDKKGPTHIPSPNTSHDFQKLISETLKLHQRFLEKCIIKLYERKQGNLNAGIIKTRFTINSKGRVENPSIVESPFADHVFQNCIEEVISRVQFKGYKGKSKTVNFPIAIQLPH